MMTSNQNGQSATILQFPVGGRAGFLALRDSAERTQQRPVVDVGSWYHDEAIREADKSKH